MGSSVPMSRWSIEESKVDLYGGFFVHRFVYDSTAFGIPSVEVEYLNDTMMPILEISYSTLHDHMLPDCRASLVNTFVGFFLGASGCVSND